MMVKQLTLLRMLGDSSEEEGVNVHLLHQAMKDSVASNRTAKRGNVSQGGSRGSKAEKGSSAGGVQRDGSSRGETRQSFSASGSSNRAVVSQGAGNGSDLGGSLAEGSADATLSG